MKFERKFTKEKNNPYQGIDFVERNSELKNSNGSAASQKIRVTVPKSWSQVATDILAQKYLRRAGIPKINAESDCRQVFERLSGCWTDWGKRFGYFDNDQDADAFHDETRHMLAHQMAAPNSPQWFNTGLFYAYGLKGNSQGHYYVDPDTNEVQPSLSAYERPQPHACFIQSIQDDLVTEGGLMDLWTREARLFKYGSGTGTNFSNIRGEGEALSGGGTSSGLMSFLKIGDSAAGAIKSGGTTRRAAKMVCLDLDHPDVRKFINWKVEEEQKVACLVAGSKAIEKSLNEIMTACHDQQQTLQDPYSLRENTKLRIALKQAQEAHIPLSYLMRVIELAKQGFTAIKFESYNTDWNSEAYNTVCGQNSNNSLRISNDFMLAVEREGTWNTIYRTTGKIAETMNARDLWDEIAYATWACADPGLQFDTTINEWHTCPKDGKINASNPCSEYMFLDDTACNLASLNLLKFYDESSNSINLELLIHATRIWTTILDISVQMAQFPSKEIARKSWDYRTLGLGYANLGALLMRMGIAYGSEPALSMTGVLTAIICGGAYRTSAEMAKELGAFPRFKANKNDMLRVISNHLTAASGKGSYQGLSIKPMELKTSYCSLELAEAARAIWGEAYKLGQKYGFRNAQVTVIAPTGTIGLLMDCDTTGIEPDFSLVKYKKLAGGGYFKIINQSIPTALKNLGYNPKQIKDMVSYCIGHGTLADAPYINFDSLREKGLSEETLIKINKELPQTFDLSFAFNQWSIGEDFCLNKLNLKSEDLNDPETNLLRLLGFSQEEIDAANDYICGNMTLEGAPHIKIEHLAVFDCANRCGRHGKRFISADNHIKMMAAAQAFISGAISKTVNLPYEATLDDIRSIYLKSWRYMLKANALYRDGSKLSQPLNSTAKNWLNDINLTASSNEIVKDIAQKATREYINKRRKLPHRRGGYTQKVKIGGHSVYLRTGEYADGKLGEIFLDLNKEGTLLRSMMNSFAIAVSLGLQYGVPLEEFVDVFTFSKFEPNGLVQGHDYIKRSTSILDFLFRDLGINYAERHDLAHVKPDTLSDEDEANSLQTETKATHFVHVDGSVIEESIELSSKDKLAQAERSRSLIKGYSGDPCTECGALTLVRNGACMKCDSCGATTGCS
ncbi:MAG: adenosylcobalamin-dependent ribonucleoside-diphosphate reductase [Bdellovibrionota bacterium]